MGLFGDRKKQVIEQEKQAQQPPAKKGARKTEQPPLHDDKFLSATLALNLDLKRLSNLKGTPKKVEYKKGVLPEYDEVIQQWIESGDNTQFDVFVYFMIWLFDVGDYEKALALALVGIERDQVLPERFKRRDIQTFVCDELLKAYEANSEVKTQFDFALDKISNDQWDVPDEVRVKFYKRMANDLFEENPADALTWLEKVKQVDPTARVDTNINKLEARIAKAEE